nr:hypothetical protein [Tanacetum cinerariifolium]
MILHDGDERLTLNMRHDTSSYSNQPQRESVNLINIFNVSSEYFLEVLFSNQPSGNPTFSPHQELTSSEVTNDIFDSEGCNVLSEKLLDLHSTNDLHPPLHDNPLSGSTTYFSNSLLEEFTDELALITYPPDYDDNLQFDIECDLKEIEFLLYQGKDSILKDSIDQKDLANLDDNFVDPIHEMFTNEHTPDYSSPLIFDVYDDDFLKVESDAENVYDDPFDSKGEKIKESKLLINELDLPCDFLSPSEYDSFISQDFSRVDALPSTNNKDKVFNPGILIQEKPVKIITRVAQDKKLAISNDSLVLEDFDPPFYEPLFFKDVPKSKMLLPFSSENEENFFKPGIYASKKYSWKYEKNYDPKGERFLIASRFPTLPLACVNTLIDHHCCYKCGNSLNDFFCYQCTCEFCWNGAHVGYNCPAQVPCFQTLPSFPQQYPCCEDCGVLPEADHCQPPQYVVNHPIFNVYNDFLHSQNELIIAQNKLMEQITQLTSMCEMACQIIQKKQEEKRIEEEKAANARYWNIPACCDDDDDYNSAITPNEPIDSLSMGNEHLNTIPATKSDEFIKSSVENLVPNPSESEGENGCDMPACFTTFLNVLFDVEYEFDSSDDQSLSDEDVPEKIFSNPLFKEEIISMKIDPHHYNAESDLIESMLNHDSSIIFSSSKIDSLLDEFTSELTLLKSIPPGIDETDCDPKEDIRLIKRLLYDNSSPRPPKEFVSDNSDADIESFSPSHIPVEDNNSFMEEIDLFLKPDDPMPPGIEEDDDDSERDVLILEELLDNYSLSLPVIESYHFDIPSFSRPPAKPLDGNT